MVNIILSPIKHFFYLGLLNYNVFHITLLNYKFIHFSLIMQIFLINLAELVLHIYK